ncbi:MAG TPA: protein kinase [Bryobacteraceae bacterium]|jgi:serine/threonine-protein kinase
MSPRPSIAHYRIISKLGEGGMGEVWRANDTKLKRDVAIKILPPDFAEDRDRMARFTREAQVLASLNHPNIASIYGVEERALVMELVDGETLPRGLPADRVLEYAGQIAEGLEYAHEHGIVHRDLKPANIKVTPEGRVKILDFGLAKAVDTEKKSEPDAPTITAGATLAGVALGTPAYMAPEQARAQSVDRRADIWAFGVILYEMLTGKRLFSGSTVTDTLANILMAEPDLSAVSPQFRPIVYRCLRKDVRHRWQSIGDVRIALEESALSRPEGAVAVQRSSLGPWIIAAVLTVVLLAVGLLYWRNSRPLRPSMMRFTDDLGIELSANGIALSPDGSRLAFVPSDLRLHVRSLDKTKDVILDGTEGAVRPFFSPDGAWIGFFAGRKIKKVAVQGGAPITICDASNALGASWGSDGNIVFTPDNRSGLVSVPNTGGQPTPITHLNPKRNDATHRYPQILPGARAVLFTNGPPGDYEDASIEAAVLKTGERKVVYHGGYHGRYLESGHLVFLHEGELFAAPMNPDRLELTGPPTPILDDVSSFSSSANADFDFARTGTFVYIPARNSQPLLLEWMDATGKLERTNAPPKSYLPPIRVSPDGTRFAVIVQDGGARNLWIYDSRHDRMFPITAGKIVVVASTWSADGGHVIFQTGTAPVNDIIWARADGGGQPTPLLQKVAVSTFPDLSVSSDGKQLAFTSARGIETTHLDLSDPEHPRADPPRPFDAGPGRVSQPAFSPDRRWLAYVSDESGRAEVYVTAFSGPGGKWLISKNGGSSPTWSHSGHELFYQASSGRIMSVNYVAKPESFEADPPRPWSDRVLRSRNLAMGPDPRRFAVAMAADESSEKPETHVVFLLNFFDDLRRKAAAK